jgi:RNA polymerase sigma-70 factor (ECF subfamily)
LNDLETFLFVLSAREEMSMPDQKSSWDFEQEILPHLDAAYNLARWLTHNEQDAQDVVQEAFVRAFRFFGTFRGGNARAWVLRIVRNTCYNWLQQNRPLQSATEFDENLFGPDPRTPNPEEALLQRASDKMLRQALEALPLKFREVLILREFESMSYKEIAEVTGIPPGTVMSRLSRARGGLRTALACLMNGHDLQTSAAADDLCPTDS